MSEVIKKQNSPEVRVFGGSFSLTRGTNTEAARSVFYKQRFQELQGEDFVWIPRVIDAEPELIADIFKDREIRATLRYDRATGIAGVYTAVYTRDKSAQEGEFKYLELCNNVPFAVAVHIAEQFAASQWLKED